jgi:hypothetical protein
MGQRASLHIFHPPTFLPPQEKVVHQTSREMHHFLFLFFVAFISAFPALFQSIFPSSVPTEEVKP